jgi:hypothetical protein
MVRALVFDDATADSLPVKEMLEKSFSRSDIQSIFCPRTIEILGPECFGACKSLSAISFDTGCRLKRVVQWAFSYSSLVSLRIPRSVESLGVLSFCGCRSMMSISLEADCQFRRIDSAAFSL